MKIKVKETGEILNVGDYTCIYLDTSDRYYEINEVEFIYENSTIDWEQRRYEITKSLYSDIIKRKLSSWNSTSNFAQTWAKEAIYFADSLIQMLKKS